MRWMVFLPLFLLALAPVSASVLSDAANSLQPGESMKIQTPGYWESRRFSGMGFEGSWNLNWGHSAVWDPFNREVRFVGKTHSTVERHYWVIYDEASNTWCADPDGSGPHCRDLPPDLSGSLLGHGYDFNALDPLTGDHYFRRYNSGLLNRWDAASRTWAEPLAVPFPVDIADAITYYPGVGVVLTDQKGCHYSADKGVSWTACTGPSLSGVIGYNSWSEYQPNAGVLLFGGGNNNPFAVFRLLSDGSYERILDAPLPISNAVTAGKIVADPASDEYLVVDQNAAGGDWRAFDPVTSTWRTLTRAPSTGCDGVPCDGAPYLTESGSTSLVGTPISTYGVTMWLQPGDTTSDYVWIYKHAPSTPSVCGNGVIEGSEVCDGTNLNGESCVSQGFSGGSLACNAGCTSFDTSGCSVVDTVPPIRSGGAPSGSLPSGTTSTTISLDTDEAATCKYGTTPGVAYASLPNTFSTTGGTAHSSAVSGLSDGNSYSYYVRCLDGSGNANPDDYLISFSVSDPAGSLPANFILVRDRSGSLQTNRPVSVSRPFREGEVQAFVQASIGGSPVLTQTDVKNRWPDGSVKFAIVSFVVPSIPANGQVRVDFSNQASGNNDGYLSQAEMLSAAYDFDAEIALSGSASRSISARSMLSDGSFRYWLQGPVVTAVIIEDRSPARAYDTDMGDGNKALHPIFEAWFYPGSGDVQVGYTLENMWVSNDLSKSFSDQVYALTLRSGSSAPVVEYTHPSMTHIGRTRWHRLFWNGAVDPPGVSIDHNTDYLLSTRAVPNYDRSFTVAESLVASHYSSWSGKDQSLDGDAGGVGNYPRNLGSGGSAPHIGLLTTWDILYLLTMDDRMWEKSFGNADLAGRIQYFMREADSLAGTGDYFDDASSVDTFGRPISVNARRTVSLSDLSWVCTGYEADTPSVPAVVEEWGFYALGRHHMPDVAYLPYLLTGRYYYLEQLELQAAYIVGWRQGCYGAAWLRQGESGYLNDGEVRGDGWGYRTLAYAAFLSPDGSPEKAYFESKLLNNIAKDSGELGVPNPLPSLQSHYDWGRDYRMYVTGTSPLGIWDEGNERLLGNPAKQDGSLATATSPWMEHFILAALGVARDFGYPTDNLLRFQAKKIFNQLLNPVTSPYLIEGYRNGALRNLSPATDDWIRTWEEFDQYHNVPSAWATGTDVDHGYGFIALGVTSFLYPYTIDGYTGQAAWEFFDAAYPGQDRFATESPKWAMVPRETASSAVCGNGVVEQGEQCDGSAFGSRTCVTEGFDSGSLACTGSCTLDTSGCVNLRCDEQPTYNQSCSVGVGACLDAGVYACADPASTAEDPSCDATPGTPVTEVCDNLIDDDCDGSVDEGCGVFYQIDFDHTNAMTAPGWESFPIGSKNYDAGRGYGWVGGAVESRDRGNVDLVGRDFHMSAANSRFVADVPSGDYTVTLYLQDANYPNEPFHVDVEGVRAFTNIAATTALIGHPFNVTVADGQLTIDLIAIANYPRMNGLIVEAAAGSLLTCAEQSGVVCSGFYACPAGSEIPASDSAACCSVACECGNDGDLNCDGIVNVFDLVRAGSPQDRPANWLDRLAAVFSNFGREY